MEKINFTNGTTPALNATNLNKLQDNIENAYKPEAITISTSNNQNISANIKTIVQTDNIVSQIGTKITKSNNFVIIGKDINYVEVSGNIHGKTQARAWATLSHYNSNDVLQDKQDCLGYSPDDYWHSWNFPPKIVMVSEGDYFLMEFLGNSQAILNSDISNYNSSYITVKKIS